MDARQIDEIRRIVRLESLRSAVFSVASESLDVNTPALRVDIALEGDSLAASFYFLDASGGMVSGGSL